MSTATVFDDLYGSKYLSGIEVGNQTLRVEVGDVETVELRQKDGSTKRRLVLTFIGQDKQLVLNKTNATTLAQLLGKDHANWVGAKLELYTESTTFGLGIRVRPLRKPLDDKIPF